MNENTIGQNIKRARVAKKVMSKELANKMGVVASTLTGYEKGTNNISIENIKKISEILDVPVELLINGVDDRFKNDYSFEDLVQNHDLYSEYLRRLNSENEIKEIESTENKIDIFNEMINFIEEMALSHNDEKFDILYKTVQLLIKEEILKQRQENNKKNVFLNYIEDRLNPKYPITLNGIKLGLSAKEKKQLKNILPSLKSIFDI
ncbi:helix-turn-helix domain-containing protein [Ligilactobacillus aviarius]|uniref:helix-turn-helix domain-containing protein n=1 Tax=Ligilactobacillus aviarius TaxID=1606 RepID=UPI0024B9EEBF|nr:helix-turn-helix transcriptional regulator [Ligilactobacillus aviarius]